MKAAPKQTNIAELTLRIPVNKRQALAQGTAKVISADANLMLTCAGDTTLEALVVKLAAHAKHTSKKRVKLTTDVIAQVVESNDKLAEIYDGAFFVVPDVRKKAKADEKPKTEEEE